MDVACQLDRSCQAKLRDLPDTAAETRKMYEWFDKLVKVVDKFHFRDHSPTDTECQARNNPAHYPEITNKANSEAAEQLMRWLSRFKLIVNNYGVAKATLFTGTMMWAHAERAISDGCEDSAKMSNKQLGEARAAYDVKPYGAIGAAARTELAQRLLAGTHTSSEERVLAWRRERDSERRFVQLRRDARSAAGAAGGSQL